MISIAMLHIWMHVSYLLPIERLNDLFRSTPLHKYHLRNHSGLASNKLAAIHVPTHTLHDTFNVGGSCAWSEVLRNDDIGARSCTLKAYA